MTTPLRSDFTNATVAAGVHPQHHNDVATTLNGLQTRFMAAVNGTVAISRASATYTTATLAAGATEQGGIALAKSYQVLQLRTSVPARVRLYTTAAQRTADASRPIGIDPTVPGVVLDFVTTSSVGVSAAVDLYPEVIGANTESPVVATIPMAVTAVSAGAVTVTLTYVPLES